LHLIFPQNSLASLIYSYLLCPSQSARIDQYNSTPLPLSTGVPQGSIIGPIIFIVYINDLASLCKNCDTLMYADDTAILAYGKSTEEVASKLTEDMSLVSTWLTVAMFFSKNDINIKYSEEISVTYLG